MSQTSIAPYPRFKAFYPGTGNPLSGGQLWTLQPGTSGTGFLKATFTDSTGQVQNPNPVILDSNGEADVWLSGYTKLVLQDANGVQVWSRDNVSSMPSTSSPQIGEWVPQSLSFTYLSATSFSTPGDQTALFTPGERVEATVAAGTVYGTVQTSSASGSPLTTTVTVTWDSGQLDSGLSAIATGIITASQHVSLPYGSLGLFTGEVRMYAGASAPTGWLVCNGSAVSRTTYAALFNVIGTTFGAGDGSTTFNVPDMRGRVPIGAGQGNTAEGGGTGVNRVIGAKGGAETHTQVVGEFPGHTHSVPSLTVPNTGWGGPTGGTVAGTLVTAQPGAVYFTDGGQTNNYNNTGTGETGGVDNFTTPSSMAIMDPFAVVNFIIKT